MAWNNKFDFPYTCTTIDEQIERCKDILNRYLADFIEKLCPYMPQNEVTKLSTEWGKELYDAISNTFEIVRDTNIEMRCAAETQIGGLNSEIEELKKEIKLLENKLYELS